MSKVSQNIIKQLEEEQLKKDVPAFAPGDTVVVQVKVKEGDKTRLQAYEGVVSLNVTVACTLRSPYVKSLMAKVLSVYSRRTAQW